MAKKITLFLLALVVVITLLGGAAFFARHELTRISEDLPPFTHDAGEQFSEMVPMRDGIRLYTEVALPEGEGAFPAVLVRNPYAQFGEFMKDTVCGRFVRYGYACVFQDVRGQGNSEGEWVPTVHEAADGHDTLQWLVEQGFQNGNLAMVGPSYLAGVQWAAASTGLPPEVKTLVPSVYATDHRDIVYEDGMFRHETFTAWASMMKEGGATDEEAGALYQEALKFRPQTEVDTEIFGVRLPWYREMIAHPGTDDAYWNRELDVALRQTPAKLDIPVLMIGGWYDVFFGGQIRDWQRLATREHSRFIIGPWTHAGEGGEALPTPNAEGGLFQWRHMLDWLGYHLKGEPLERPPGVTSYVMRDNTWIERRQWPPPTDTQRFYLAKPELSHECEGGRLQGFPSADQGSIDYRYDPDNPVPTRGGSGMLAFILPGFHGAPPATVWQQGLCDREDVISFVSEPFEQPLRIAGPIRVRLNVASTAPDTAFTAKLVEVLSDGRAVNIRDSITSLGYRNDAGTRQPYEPGEPIAVDIDLWPIEWTVQPGSRLRLDISSSDFPKFHAHPNKAKLWSAVTGTQAAVQTVYAGGARQSWIELGVVE